jgi:hypothetical protein
MMKVQVVSYTDEGMYFNYHAEERIGVNAVPGTIECGYIEDDVWKRIDVFVETRITQSAYASTVHFIHVVIPRSLPNGCIVALVQELTPSAVAITPLASNQTRLKEWKTEYCSLTEEA